MNSTFDIFLGSDKNNDASWLECVEGLDAATKRMHEIAAKRPGRYFVLNLYERLVAAKTNTTRRKRKMRREERGTPRRKKNAPPWLKCGQMVNQRSPKAPKRSIQRKA